VHAGFWWGYLREEHHLKDLGEDGRVILSESSISWVGGIFWISLAQNRDMWQAVLNTVMNLGVLQTAENFLTS
jgi:hypothetical protein